MGDGQMIPQPIFSLKHVAYKHSVYRNSVPRVKMVYKLNDTSAG